MGGGKNKCSCNCNGKCGGLSTAQRTMRLSTASVEMTHLFVCSLGLIETSRDATTTTTTKAKCGGLSTAQRAMRLSAAPVEMTKFGLGEEANTLFQCRVVSACPILRLGLSKLGSGTR